MTGVVRWMSDGISRLNDDDNFNLRWQDMVALWEASTLKPEVRDKVSSLREWEFPSDHDAVKDTTMDLYASRFILGKMSTTLGISLPEWLKQPRFKCDRDLAIVESCNKIRTDALEDEFEE